MIIANETKSTKNAIWLFCGVCDGTDDNYDFLYQTNLLIEIAELHSYGEVGGWGGGGGGW